MSLETIAENRCFGGVQGTYAHAAETTGCTMRFSVYRPARADQGPVPVLWWLSGLTCTEENFTVKAGAGYLGHDCETWKRYDATELIKSGGVFPPPF